jgi:peptidoglycan/xylan/chitin deacetylase (PgdA/CDA1 family)
LFWFVIFTAAALLAVAAYTAGPYAWGFCTHGLVRKGGIGSSFVALTFDDGPDPQYTPRCLEILKAHDVHATFFLVGRKAKMHPELVRQILAEGHDIGNHTWSHRHHWKIGPTEAMRDVRAGSTELAQSTGDRVRYFRPSFGVMNLFSYWEARRLGQRCVLWSVAAADWAGGAGGKSADTIVATVAASLNNGSIILLHDSGGADGAPETMLHALPQIINEARRRGLRPVALREMLETAGSAR